MGIILFNLRDLQRLERRISKVQKEQAPPTLRMVVLNDETESAEVFPYDFEEEKSPLEIVKDPWTLSLNIEKKPEGWDK